MKDFDVFSRGQVWYWKDPIYGSKEEGKDIDAGEAALRYSRYVVIIQSNESRHEDSFCGPNILVAPFTTGSSIPYDVPMLMFNETPVNIRCKCITPVSVRCLHNYVGVVSDNVLAKINESISKLLLSNIVSNEIIISNYTEDPHKESTDYLHDDNIDKIKIESNKNKTQQWTEKRISEFLHVYSTKGINGVMSEFNIKEGTAKSYYYKWKNLYTSDISNDISLPSSVDIFKSISKVANYIKDSLRKYKIFNETSQYLKIASSYNNADDFYNRIGTAIYASLIHFLGISQYYDIAKSGEPFTQQLSLDTPHIDTWRFFDRIYHDTRVSYEKDPIKAITNYRNIFGEHTGIDSEWISSLLPIIIDRVGLEEKGGIIITNKISEIWCTRGYNKATLKLVN